MTTDTIPEAVKAAGSLHQYEPTLTQLKKAISQACLAYHKRKLEEWDVACGTAKDSQIATLQKQLDEVEEYRKVAVAKVSYLTVLNGELQKQCEELRREKELGYFGMADAKELSLIRKERDDLRTRAEKAEADAATINKCLSEELSEQKILASSYYDRWHETLDKLAKVEAEVAELKSKYQENHSHKMELQDQLTQLQQDVRPLVSKTQQAANQIKRSPTWDSHISGSWQILADALETFLAKHPELKP